jgi:hypothetical protein
MNEGKEGATSTCQLIGEFDRIVCCEGAIKGQFNLCMG